MSFKADTIKLKRLTSDPSSPTDGLVALVGASSGTSALKYYDGAWKSVDSSPSNSNTIHTASWSGNVTLVKDTNVESLVFYNITGMGGSDRLLIPPVANYGTHAQLQVINGSDKIMTLQKESGSDQRFWWRASNNSAQVTSITLGRGQRALFLKTSQAYWEVIVLSL